MHKVHQVTIQLLSVHKCYIILYCSFKTTHNADKQYMNSTLQHSQDSEEPRLHN